MRGRFDYRYKLDKLTVRIFDSLGFGSNFDFIRNELEKFDSINELKKTSFSAYANYLMYDSYRKFANRNSVPRQTQIKLFSEVVSNIAFNSLVKVVVDSVEIGKITVIRTPKSSRMFDEFVSGVQQTFAIENGVLKHIGV